MKLGEWKVENYCQVTFQTNGGTTNGLRPRLQQVLSMQSVLAVFPHKKGTDWCTNSKEKYALHDI